MDGALRGHGYAKNPIDVACWDLLGKATGKDIATLLGGRLQETFPLYRAIPLGPPDEMKEYVLKCKREGINHFQVKVGANPYEDAERVRIVVESTNADDYIIADANGGWCLQDAIIAARLMEPLQRVFLDKCSRPSASPSPRRCARFCGRIPTS